MHIRAFVFDAADVPVIDVTAAQLLVDFADDLDCEGIRLLLARDVGEEGALLEKRLDPALSGRVVDRRGHGLPRVA